MASIKFFIKGIKDPTMIYLRLRDGRKIDFTLSTGLSIRSKFWNSKEGKISSRASFQNKNELEKILKRLENILFDKRNERISEKKELTKEWFVNTISSINSHQTPLNNSLICHIQEYITKSSTNYKNGKQGISPGTIKNYNTSIYRLKKYEHIKKRKINLLDLDLDFYHDYLKFAAEELGLSANSIGRDIKHIKTICNDARDNGIDINPMSISRKFRPLSEKALFTTLTVKDLEILMKFDGSDYLNNARDWLVIGCWTGCRVGDLMKLNKDNIFIQGDNINIIQLTQSKTNKQVKIPIHQDVSLILKRSDGFPRPISSSKFNKYIKEVCKKAGINELVKGSKQNPITHKKEIGTFEKWELIRSHSCRRSFATNHYNKLSNKSIMAVTGHHTEHMMLSYIGEIESEHINEYLHLWKI